MIPAHIPKRGSSKFFTHWNHKDTKAKKSKKGEKELDPKGWWVRLEVDSERRLNCGPAAGCDEMAPQDVGRTFRSSRRRLPQVHWRGLAPSLVSTNAAQTLSRRAPLLSVTPTLGPLPSRRRSAVNLTLNRGASAGVSPAPVGAPPSFYRLLYSALNLRSRSLSTFI